MKAMVLKKIAPIETSPLELQEMEKPSLGYKEVLIRVEACGLCHTDLHTIEGDLPEVKLPIIPGHQVVGQVAEVEAHSSRFRVGDRVGVAWLYTTCGRCSFCLSGQENLCLQARFTGYHVNGGYAEYIVASEDFVYPLSKEMEAVNLAPLMCAGIIGYRALRLSQIKPGETLALFGFGASAHLTIQVALYWGCKVFVFSRSQAHRQLALEMGASWAGTAAEDPPELARAAIIFAPAGELVPRALEIVDRGGIVALAGIHMTPIPQLNYEKHLYHEKILRSVANSTRQDGQEFLELATKIPVKTKVQIFPLEEANKALLQLKRGLINGAAVLKIN